MAAHPPFEPPFFLRSHSSPNWQQVTFRTFLDTCRSLISTKPDNPLLMDISPELNNLILDYLASGDSYNDPQAMDLLSTPDGEINHGLYWPHLRECYEGSRGRERMVEWLEQQITVPKLRRLDASESHVDHSGVMITNAVVEAIRTESGV